MIFLKKTYRDVAREISEGLASGSVTLESPEIRSDIGILTAFLFQYLHPTRLAYAITGAAGVGTLAGRPNLTVEIEPEEYEGLPDEVKTRLREQLQELQQKGAEIEIRDARGNRIPLGRTIGRV
jgi:hypothetical protein